MSGILLLDGGMGTTLENLGYDVSSSMWGSELISNDPKAITQVHESYIHAGSDIIETATYQLTLKALQRSGHSLESAKDVLHDGVALANKAAVDSGNDVKVALSLGPFGATLSPGQEYKGFYPPPYGPSAFHRDTPNTNIFDDIPTDLGAEEALARFHLDRLRVYAEGESWEGIGWIAFETIPLVREMRAIRRAMGRLSAELGKEKKYWIGSAYPSGFIGQMAGSGYAGVEDVVEALFGRIEGEESIPDGVAINCTHPQYLSSLSSDLSKAFISIKSSRSVSKPISLVLYPDGGAVYDVVTRTWSSGKIGADDWAKDLWNVGTTMEGLEVDGEKVWGQVILGGCCKSSFGEIAALKDCRDSSS